MLFRCPVCKQNHSVPDNYDTSDYICQNTDGGRWSKTFNDLTPEDLLSRNRPMFNRMSTKVDETRPATIIKLEREDKINRVEKNY